jgi:FdhD protein
MPKMRNTTRVKTSAGADSVAVEEPLTINIDGRRSVVLMRTPGCEKELAAGFLKGEGIIKRRGDIATITYCDEGGFDDANTVRVRLAGRLKKKGARRLTEIRSSCGICGADAVRIASIEKPAFPKNVKVSRELLSSLPDKMRARQTVFKKTGGTHAAAIFDAVGRLVVCREDIGRHNAFDKAVGHALLAGIDLSDKIAVLSGRVSYEMILKAVRAPLPIVAAVSAPTSLAVSMAKAAGITLVCFLRSRRVKIYSSPSRISR